MEKVRLTLVFKPTASAKAQEELVAELVEDTVRKVLAKHSDQGYVLMDKP